MKKFNTLAKRMLAAGMSLVLVAAFPLPAFAEESTPATISTAQTGPAKPSGADANTYSYNSQTGMWENEHYIWDPVTQKTTPKDTLTYSYNPATGRWDTTEWVYDAPSGKYVPNTVSVTQPPAGANKIIPQTAPTSLSSASSSKPVSSSKYDNFYDASISNKVDANAKSGDASVSGNTTAGSATSGDAQSIANIINLLQSSGGALQNSNLATFMYDIYGNVQGDFTIDPQKLAAAKLPVSNSPVNTTINSSANAAINNDINLGSTSGNAAVTTNTKAGSATSGDADAVANIVNLINSAIGSKQAFLGMINIHGNLNGDILLPPGTIEALLASNSPATVTTGKTKDNNLTATITTNSAITNNLNLNATSGAAEVSNNTSAGNATTGNASTNITVLNLTGKQVIGKDCLLVFVNVLGKWVGMIVNAPSGSTAAALGGGLSKNSSLPSGNTELNSTTYSSINNNVNLASQSGNALVSQNTSAGNATSGNATASANILNISYSSISLSDWLGILFINVFGSWNGSFGINTAAGNPSMRHHSTISTKGPNSPIKVFGFIPQGTSSNTYQVSEVSESSNPTALLASATVGDNKDHKPTALLTSASTSGPSNPSFKTSGGGSGSLLWVIGGITAMALINTPDQLKKRRERIKSAHIDYIQSLIVHPLKKI